MRQMFTDRGSQIKQNEAVFFSCPHPSLPPPLPPLLLLLLLSLTYTQEVIKYVIHAHFWTSIYMYYSILDEWVWYANIPPTTSYSVPYHLIITISENLLTTPPSGSNSTKTRAHQHINAIISMHVTMNKINNKRREFPTNDTTLTDSASY